MSRVCLADAVGGAARQFVTGRHACFGLIRTDGYSILTLLASTRKPELGCADLTKAASGWQRLPRDDLCSAFELQQQFENSQSLQHVRSRRLSPSQVLLDKRCWVTAESSLQKRSCSQQTAEHHLMPPNSSHPLLRATFASQNLPKAHKEIILMPFTHCGRLDKFGCKAGKDLRVDC